MSEKNLPITYLNGVLLWINAIQDSYLWIDSPDCFFFKADHIQGNHDLNSSIRRANGEHRFLATISDVDNVIGNRNNVFVETLSGMASKDFTKLIFVSSMPMNQLVWSDYEGIIKTVKETYDKPIFSVPSRSMTSCWLDGYSDLLFSLAKNIPTNDVPERKKTNIAIVGNLFDRNEGDCIGNVEELKNICTQLGLDVVSIWLDGGNYEDVLRANEAGTILSLPYGRKAAKMLAKRLDADLLELDVPFGIQNTISFIQKLGTHFGKSEAGIQAIVTNETTKRNNLALIQWWVQRGLFNKRVSYYGDPYLLNGIIDFSEMFGWDLQQIFIHGDEKHMKNNKSETYKKLPNIAYELGNELEEVDIFIANRANNINNLRRSSLLEFWFPSYFHHTFTPQPFFGIRGGLNFINRIFNILSEK